MNDDIYVCDADALINLYRHFGRGAVRALKRAMKMGKLKLPQGVVHEILRGTDRLKTFVRNNRQHIEVKFTKADLRLEDTLRDLEVKYGERIQVGGRAYPGFWHSRAGRKSADAQVIAVAKVKGWIAVSDDTAIKQVCHVENVPCIGWNEFARRLELGVQQLTIPGLLER